jgi:hypothetical protein
VTFLLGYRGDITIESRHSSRPERGASDFRAGRGLMDEEYKQVSWPSQGNFIGVACL